MDFASPTPSSGSTDAEPTGRVLGVIPARLESSRLPRKPLHPLLGRPMIQWAGERARTMGVLDEVVVATDAQEIIAACQAVGVKAILTDPGHPSGTDRIAEVVGLPGYRDVGVVVNLQGDEPLLDGGHVGLAVAEVRRGRDAGTCATPIRDPQVLRDPAAVKVVRRADGTALYFSRAPIPHRRDGPMEGDFLARSGYLRHLGLYAYRRDALLEWVALPPSPLEEIERLEQLRALEAGMTIGVAVVEHAESGVDTLDDARRTEQRMRELGLGS